MSICAGIDIGTNTILLLIARVEHGEIKEVLEDHVRVVRLGEGLVESGLFSEQAMQRARDCFTDYREILDKYKMGFLRAAATAGARAAGNAEKFFAEVKENYGIAVDIISGEEEAQLSFLGSVEGNPRDAAVLDIGGGSTEIVGVLDNSEEMLLRHSFPVGCVKMHERFLSDRPTDSELTELRTFLQENFAGNTVLQSLRAKNWIAVAGTATYLAAAHLGLPEFSVEKVHGHTLQLYDVTTLIDRLKQLTAAERLGIGGMDQGRADVIVAGAVILQTLMQEADVASVQVSCRGMRFGLVLTCV